MKLNQLPWGPQRIDGNCVLSSGLAVIGGTATAFSTTVIVNYVIDGIIRALAAQTNTALTPLVAADLPVATGANYLQPSGLAGFYSQPAGTTTYSMLGVNAAGTVRLVQGTYVGQQIAPVGYTALGDGNCPDVPDGFVPFAIMKIISGGAVFLPGTTVLTGVATFLNILAIPSADRPF